MLAHLGRVEDARADLLAGFELTQRSGDVIFESQIRRSLGFLELSLGDGPAAVAWLEPMPENVRAIGAREPTAFCFEPELCEALVLSGNTGAARLISGASPCQALGTDSPPTW